MDVRNTRNRGTENKLSGPTRPAALAQLPAEKESVVDQLITTPITSDIDEALEVGGEKLLGEVGKRMGWLLGYFGVGEIILKGAILAWKEAHLPPDTLRLAFADGYATGLTYATFGQIQGGTQPIGWTGDEHLGAFAQGKAEALRDIAASRPLTEPQFFEQVLHSRALRLNVKPLLAADTAKKKRDQRYKGAK